MMATSRPSGRKYNATKTSAPPKIHMVRAWLKASRPKQTAAVESHPNADLPSAFRSIARTIACAAQLNRNSRSICGNPDIENCQNRSQINIRHAAKAASRSSNRRRAV